MRRVVDLVRQATSKRRKSPERVPRLIQGTSVAAAAQCILGSTTSFGDELTELAKLACELPLLDSSQVDEAQLVPTRDSIRELRDIGEDIHAFDKAVKATSPHSDPKSILGIKQPKPSKKLLHDLQRRSLSISERLHVLIAKLHAQEPLHVPQLSGDVVKAELLLHNGLGLPLPVVWQILDMAEYWVQIRFTDPLELDQWDSKEPSTMKLRASVPEVPSFKAVRKVVLAIGGHNMLTYWGSVDQSWHSFEVQTGGDLPSRSVTHYRPPEPYWQQDIPAVHLITWRYDDDGETERAIASLRPGASLHITATAPGHRLWKEHVVPLRVELYYSCL